MPDHSIPRRAVIGAGLGLGVSALSGTAQAQDTLPKVLLVSSIDTTLIPDLIAKFQAPLMNIATVTVSPFGPYKGKDTKPIEASITSNNLTTFALIVTIVGNIAYDAAANVSTINFISLLGNRPKSPPSLFLGGVLLDSIASHHERLAMLKDKGIDSNAICLYYNGNSSMSADELKGWPKNWRVVKCSGDNDSTLYGKDFPNVIAKFDNPAVSAVVISSDPYFQSTKSDLISAANDWLAAGGSYVIYPSQQFNTGAKSGSIMYGPDLGEAYRKMGEYAAIILNEKTPPNRAYLGVRDTRTDIN
jgi:hypothetical protein